LSQLSKRGLGWEREGSKTEVIMEKRFRRKEKLVLKKIREKLGGFSVNTK